MNKKYFKNPFKAFFYAFEFFIGRFNWSSPPWIKYLAYQARSRPKTFWTLSTLTLSFFFLLGYGYFWYKNQPQPPLITAVILPPKSSVILDNKLIPDNLTLNFGLENNSSSKTNLANNFLAKSVAPLNQIGKEVTKGIAITPEIKGKWFWENDNQLLFIPNEDWPSEQIYSIHFDTTFFSPEAKIKQYDYSFSTLPFEANIRELSFYQDPTHPEIKQAVATIGFNFPVDPSSFESKISLFLQQQLKQNKPAEHYKFTISYDDNKRFAYLRSESLSLSNLPRYLTLLIDKKIKSLSGKGKTKVALSKNLLIPDREHYFKVLSVEGSIVRNEQDRPEQVLSIETSLGVSEGALKKSLHAYLLPQDYPATLGREKKKNYEWQIPGEVTAAILKSATPLSLEPLLADRDFSTQHHFKFTASSSQYIYITLDKGLRGLGDFTLNQGYALIIKAPEYPKEISFLHKGALLALSSEKKLSVLVRGLSSVKFDFARILPENINQLVTQTQGDFNNPYFINQSFTQQNISQIFSEIKQFNSSDPTKQQYTALDFSKYFSTSANAPSRGLFLLQATGWDSANNLPLDVKASRFILITDLGLIVKDNQDGSHDVFVQSISTGIPLPKVTLSVLGKNGLALLSFTTDKQGRAHFPSLIDFKEEKEPVAYLATFGNDLSFIPYNNFNRQINYSRYDIGGMYNNPQENSLNAYLFSDRGIYRPGDKAHIGMIIKQSYSSPPPGVMLEATITDPRGNTIKDHKFIPNTTGYESLDFSTYAYSPTGQYIISLYITKDNHPHNLIGSLSIQVAEFQPDRMRIQSRFSKENIKGWVSPEALKAKIKLWNLYGGPAENRRISGKILLSPQRIEFKEYPDYIFFDPLADPDKPPKVVTDNLTDLTTDEKGEAEFDLNLKRFNKASYRLRFFAEGFEAAGGRSVATQSEALVSPLAFFIGYKPDGNLNYIKQYSDRNINFIAVNSNLNTQAVGDLKIQLASLHPVTTLVKKPNGSYQYQSIIRSEIISTQAFSVKNTGELFTLPTQKIGDYLLTILDKNNTELNHFKYSVVGSSQFSLSKNAELQVKLNKDEFKAGEEIELEITSPYTGTGLITIERDKLYAIQWFKSQTTTSIQKIRIPSDFQGNGYVNLSFVRDWNSPDIYLSPLSYSIIPFTVDHDKYKVNINLNVPPIAKPGGPFRIEYSSNKPGKIIVYAVDEGILHVTNYLTPDPLAYFFQKRALEVNTQQTVDQILPQYIQERELSAAGGDGGEAILSRHLNPFKRKSEAPVIYWSGIVDTDSTTRQLSYTLPDYFNGQIRVMAVAVTPDALGSTDKKADIRGNFVINPNIPSFLSPGDSVEITASIANQLKNSGPKAKVKIKLTTSSSLNIIGQKEQSLIIPEGHEKTIRFQLKAGLPLGSAKINLSAQIGHESTQTDSSLSIRPSNPFITTINSGESTDKIKRLAIERQLYSEYQSSTAIISNNPLSLVTGLQKYLTDFPYGCTEQLISKAMPLLALLNQPESLIQDNDKPQLKQSIQTKLLSIIQQLNQRQLSNGSFSYWPNTLTNPNNDFTSIYAMHFLTEAQTQGYSIPHEVFNSGLNYLKEFALQTPKDLSSARIQAYAIYILTCNEIITSNYLTHLQLYLDKVYPKIWRQDLTGAYIAATYQLLKASEEAQELIRQFEPTQLMSNTTDLYDSNIANAQYLYLIARHFPERLSNTGKTLVLKLIAAINDEEINTLLSSYISLALNAYAQSLHMNTANFSIDSLLENKKIKTLLNTKSGFGKATIPQDAKQIIFKNPDQHRFFYQVMQAGFDKTAFSQPKAQNLEIHREFRKEGQAISQVNLGDEIEVHLKIRTLNNKDVYNIALTDLLPGGFEVIPDSIKRDDVDYVDIREDRVIFFTTAFPSSREFSYRIKATNVGHYRLPPLFAEAMYQPSIKANSVENEITVNNPG